MPGRDRYGTVSVHCWAPPSSSGTGESSPRYQRYDIGSMLSASNSQRQRGQTGALLLGRQAWPNRCSSPLSQHSEEASAPRIDGDFNSFRMDVARRGCYPLPPCIGTRRHVRSIPSAMSDLPPSTSANRLIVDEPLERERLGALCLDGQCLVALALARPQAMSLSEMTLLRFVPLSRTGSSGGEITDSPRRRAGPRHLPQSFVLELSAR